MPDRDDGRDDGGISRRTFLARGLQIAGVATAAGCSPTRQPEKLIPYLIPPEHIVPGTPLFYRTACRECGAGCGVTARTREGRAIKLEGNPEDPIGGGALCARGQASLQRLYAPDRLKGPLRRDPAGKLAAVGWDDALATVAAALAEERKLGGHGVRLLTRPEPGSAGALQRAFLGALGASPEQRVVLEPFDPTALRAASAALFGRAGIPAYDLRDARSVVSFGADFLETWVSPVELSRGLAAGRGRLGPERTLLTWIAPRLSATGAAADRWLACRRGGEAALAEGVLRWLLDPANGVRDLAPEAQALRPRLLAIPTAEIERRSGVAWSEVARLGEELSRRRPSALLGPGVGSAGPEATRLAALVHLLNHVLGNVGRTVLPEMDPLADPPDPFARLQALVGDMNSGRVRVLLVHHADPLATLPPPLQFAEAISKVPLVVSFSDQLDPIASRAHFVLPDHHPLESFGDVSPRNGVVILQQPTMTPLHDTRSASQVLLDLAGKVPLSEAQLPTDLYDYVQARHAEYAKQLGVAGDPAAERTAVERGGWFTAAKPAPVTLAAGAAERFLAAAPEPARTEGELDLLVFPTGLRGDGAGGERTWLQEVPDTITTISWTAWVELSPQAAARLAVGAGDLLAISTAAGRVELPLYVQPGLRDDVVAVPLGGPEALALLPAAVEAGSGALIWQSARARVEATGRRALLPRQDVTPYEPEDDHPVARERRGSRQVAAVEPREIVRTVSAAAPAVPHPAPFENMYPTPPHPVHRWAMAIDLDRCTGCQACVVACYAENNVQVMGAEEAARGRNMAWLRIERYFTSEGGQLHADTLPMLCQHCTSAPCEPVCPVYATYHTAEGLNAQVYNRCVGTRYCSNNCPYKVRTFNWRDPDFPAPLNMQLNPDVTVRSKGVMEKCTFCVQRIRYAENQARTEGRAVRDGEVVPACAQTCPGQAMVFGDENDPTSRVAALRRDPRGYAVLEELNTRPAITYLARVREPGK